MQGRLSPQIGQSIQAFPIESWQSEFSLANDLGLDGIEWTVDLVNYQNHPLFCGKYILHNFIGGSKSKFVTCDFYMQANLYENVSKNLGIVKEILFELISSKALGTGSTLVIPLVDQGAPRSDLHWKIVLSLFSEITPLLQQYNSQIVFELEISPDDQNKFLCNFDPNRFGINYDIGNSASLGWDPVDEIIKLGNNIKHIHVKDRILNGTTVPLGTGNADFKKVVDSLDKIGYKNNYTLQCARIHGQAESTTIKAYIEFLRKVGLF